MIWITENLNRELCLSKSPKDVLRFISPKIKSETLTATVTLVKMGIYCSKCTVCCIKAHILTYKTTQKKTQEYFLEFQQLFTH